MVTVNRTAPPRAPMGIMAPRPQSLIAGEIKAKQRVEIRPGEPVFVFIERRMGTGGKLAGLNKDTPFSITRLSKAPAGVAVPRTMGDWYKISLKEGEKAGQTDQIKLVERTVTLKPKITEKPFTLVSGSQRYY